MKEDIAEQWCKALRSDEYEQGKNQLRKGDKFCCMGVLSDLAVKAGLGEWNEGTYRHTDGRCGKVSCDVELVLGVQQWSGVQTCQGQVGRDDLIRMNDRGVGFPEIADFIEANVKEL